MNLKVPITRPATAEPLYQNSPVIPKQTVTLNIRAAFIVELSGVTQTFVSLSCPAFEIRGATINECINRWHRLKHGIDDYSDIQIKAIRIVVGGNELSRIDF